jgi:hypothetical protein
MYHVSAILRKVNLLRKQIGYGHFYLIHNYFVYNIFRLVFRSHVCQSTKMLSPTEKFYYLETTAAILRFYFFKNLDTHIIRLLKYRQASLNLQVIRCLSSVWHNLLSSWRKILKLRPRLAVKLLFTIHSIIVTVNTTYPMLLRKRRRIGKKQIRNKWIKRSYLSQTSKSHGRYSDMISFIALLWCKVSHTR